MKKLILFITVSFLSAGMVNAQAPSWAWENGISGNIIQSVSYNEAVEGYNVITDSEGSVYTIGIFETPTMIIGNYTLTNTSNAGDTANVFIAKNDAAGNVLWAKNIKGSNDFQSLGITVDAANNIYITGGFISQTITFDTKTITKTSAEGMDDIFIAKYTPGGNIIWAKSYGGSNDDYGNAITVDHLNNIYITGTFKSAALSIDSYTLTNDLSSNPNMFMAKFDSSGNVLFAKSIGQSCTIGIGGNNIISDLNNNIYVTGSFSNSEIIVGNDTLFCNANSFNMFLVKYDEFGNMLWIKSARGGNYSVLPNDVSVDALGNVYITGNFVGNSLIIGKDTLTTSWYTGFLAKYSSSGKILWARNLKTYTTDLNTAANHVAASANNGVCIGGSFMDQNNGIPPLVFGNDTLINGSSTSSAIYVARYDSSGNSLWGKTAKSNTSCEISEITLDKYENIYVTGSYQSYYFIFDNDTLRNTNNSTPGYEGSQNYFIAKIGTVGVGIEKYGQMNGHISLYPNPSNGNINIISSNNIDELKVTDLLGQTVYEAKPMAPATTLTLENAGVYFVTLTCGKEVSTQKVVVNK